MRKKVQMILLLLVTFIAFSKSLAYADVASPAPRPPAFDEPAFPFEDLVEKPSPTTDKFLSDLFNMLATLGLIIAVILIAAWFIKRLAATRQQQANVSSSIKILERRALSPKTAVYLIEIEGTGILMAESVNGVTRLAEFPVAKETSFSSVMDSK